MGKADAFQDRVDMCDLGIFTLLELLSTGVLKNRSSTSTIIPSGAPVSPVSCSYTPF